MLCTGSCSCGYTTITVTALPLTTTNCHCSDCRTSLDPPVPFLTFTAFPSSSITFTPPIPPIPTSSVATRTYCPSTCKELLAMNYNADPARIHVLASKIDKASWAGGVEPEGMRPIKHIFVGDKDPDELIPDDGLPRFLGFRDGKPGTDGSFEMVQQYDGERAGESGKSN